MSRKLLGSNKIATAFLMMVSCYYFSDIAENFLLKAKWQESEAGHQILDGALYFKIIGSAIAAVFMFMSSGIVTLIAWLNISFIIKVIAYLVFQSIQLNEIKMLSYLIISGFADGAFFLSTFVIYFTQGINLQRKQPVTYFTNATTNNPDMMLRHLLFIISFSMLLFYTIYAFLEAFEWARTAISFLVYAAFLGVAYYLWQLKNPINKSIGLEVYNPNILQVAKYIQLEILGVFTMSFIALKLYYHYALFESTHHLLMISSSKLYLLLIGALIGVNSIRFFDLKESLTNTKIKCYILLLLLFATMPNWGGIDIISHIMWPIIFGIIGFLFICNQYSLMNKFSGNNLVVALLINAIFCFGGMLSEAIEIATEDIIEIESSFISSISLLLATLGCYNFYILKRRMG